MSLAVKPRGRAALSPVAMGCAIPHRERIANSAPTIVPPVGGVATGVVPLQRRGATAPRSAPSPLPIVGTGPVLSVKGRTASPVGRTVGSAQPRIPVRPTHYRVRKRAWTAASALSTLSAVGLPGTRGVWGWPPGSVVSSVGAPTAPTGPAIVRRAVPPAPRTVVPVGSVEMGSVREKRPARAARQIVERALPVETGSAPWSGVRSARAAQQTVAPATSVGTGSASGPSESRVATAPQTAIVVTGTAISSPTKTALSALQTAIVVTAAVRCWRERPTPSAPLTTALPPLRESDLPCCCG